MTWGLVVVRRLVWNMIFYYFYDLYNHTWKDGAMMGSREGLGDRGLRGRAPLKPIQVSFLKVLFFWYFVLLQWPNWFPPWFEHFFCVQWQIPKLKIRKEHSNLPARGGGDVNELVQIQNHPYFHNLTVPRAQQVPATRHSFYPTRFSFENHRVSDNPTFRIKPNPWYTIHSQNAQKYPEIPEWVNKVPNWRFKHF